MCCEEIFYQQKHSWHWDLFLSRSSGTGTNCANTCRYFPGPEMCFACSSCRHSGRSPLPFAHVQHLGSCHFHSRFWATQGSLSPGSGSYSTTVTATQMRREEGGRGLGGGVFGFSVSILSIQVSQLPSLTFPLIVICEINSSQCVILDWDMQS